MGNYTIRRLENTEFDLLIPLMNDSFGTEVDLQYFDWKFIKNPAGFVEGFIAISEEGEVAAYYGAIPEVYIIDGRQTTIYQSCDTMTHSRHRRKGLFQKLALYCYEYLRSENKLFVIGFGGGQSTPGFLKFGWEHIFDIQNYFIPTFLISLRQSGDVKNVTEITRYEDIADTILHSNDKARIHSHKTMEAFRWRLSNPLYDYKVIAYGQGAGSKKYTSYLVYYIAANKIVVFDFYFQDRAAGQALVGYVKKLLKTAGVKGIIAFCQKDSAYSDMLRQNGFIYNPFSKGPLSLKTPFIFFTDKDKMANYRKASDWQINSFDHDAM